MSVLAFTKKMTPKKWLAFSCHVGDKYKGKTICTIELRPDGDEYKIEVYTVA